MKRAIHILFIDDQWCIPENREIILGAYGSLRYQKIPYIFHYETAENQNGGYSVEPVMEKIKGMPNLDIAVLDVIFGAKDNFLGLDILKSIRANYPNLPVVMMTSMDERSDLPERIKALGANEYFIKKPTLKKFELLVTNYINK